MRLDQIHLFPVHIDFDLLDAGGVVHHPNYLILCERARVAAMEDSGFSFGQLWAQGYSFALVDTKSKYLRPATLGQKLQILTRTLSATGATMTIEQELISLNSLDRPERGYMPANPNLALAEKYFWFELRVACIRLSPLKPTRIPLEIRNALNLDTRLNASS